HRATGTEVLLPHFLGLQAEALGRSGQAEEGLQVADDALEMAHRTGEGYYQAELYRIRGQLLLMRRKGRSVSRAATGPGNVRVAEPAAIAEAEGCFNQSIKIAQQQGATSWELRATMNLARLRQRQGRCEEARSLLARIYDRFTEGFETADLRDATSLLAELSK
ncbi:MAG TPA: hypothetical protein PLF26_08695, partial [Blastocatellia bacterium]|nr:hypothetical protein [Blastocatellia bacterium]